MKTKLFSLLGLSVLVLMMFMSFGSAEIEFVPSEINQSIFHGQTSTTINFKLNETEGVNYTNLTLEGTTNHGSWSLPIITSLDANELLSFSETLSSIPDDFIGTITGTLTLKDVSTNETMDTLSVSIEVKGISEITECSLTGKPGDIRIKKIDFTNNGIPLKTFGDDDKWFLFEEIEAEIQIKNYGNERVDNIEVWWGIYNTKEHQWIIEPDDLKDFDLKSDKTETLTVSFSIDDDIDVNLEELSDGDYYRFYVWAIGEVDTLEFPETCVSDYKTAEIIIEDDFIILNDFQFPELVSCGTDVQITADVWNVGDREQEDVYVIVYNKELGINEEIEIGDIDDFEDKKLVFEFQVPEDAEEKWYTLKFTVYDEDDEIYENDYDDDKSEFLVSFKVEGSCIVEPQVIVTASLESGGKAGQELVIKATVTNTGSKVVTYELNAADYADWASLESVEPSTIVLNAGESADVLITFNVNTDVSGDKLFNIEVLLEDEPVVTQPVSVTIEKSGFSFITGDIISEGNWYLWGIGALNIILIVVIILVALRVAKKS